MPNVVEVLQEQGHCALQYLVQIVGGGGPNGGGLWKGWAIFGACEVRHTISIIALQSMV